MNILFTTFSFFIVLGVLVFFHELGHYWVARRNGIVVEEFGMGYPPRLLKLFRYNGTDFTLNLIPFGGFARMKGEDAGDMTPGAFNAASRAGRAATLIAGPAMNAILAIVFFAASFMAGFPAAAAYPQLVDVPANSVAAQVGVQPGDVLLAADGAPTLINAAADADYNVSDRTENLPDGVPAVAADEVAVLRDGSVVTLAGLPNAAGSTDELLAGADFERVLSTRIAAVAPGSPADEAGLQAGDSFYAVNGTVITPEASLSDLIQDNLDQMTALTLLRGDRLIDVELEPRANPPAGEGAIGVQLTALSTIVSQSLPSAVWSGVRQTGQYMATVVGLPFLLLSGVISPADATLSGPVGIAREVGGAMNATVSTGLLYPILSLSAILSAALAITNLLPLPALDGGRLVFILVETLRGRRINPEREGLVHMAGFLLLISLLVFITIREIIAPAETLPWMDILGQ